MAGGRAEFDQYCIRPFSGASPALTFGDGVNPYRYCGLLNCHVSGTVSGHQVTGGAPTAANSAAQALLLKGGTIGFTTDDRCVIYSGIQTVALQPSATQPVTGCVLRGIARNDTTGSASCRAIYSQRLADPGYNTNNQILMKVNSTGSGYAGEFDGTAKAVNALVGGYWDILPALGILLKGSGSTLTPLVFLQLDPGASNVVVLETNDTGQDISRYVIGGQLFADAQTFKSAFGGGTLYPIPASTWFYTYGQVIRNPYLRLPINMGTSTNPFPASPAQIDSPTDVGPLRAESYDGLVSGSPNATPTGEYWGIRALSELITLNTGGLTTDSVANLLPAGSIIEAVVARVTVTITTTTTWALGDSTTPQRFAPNNASLASGTVVSGTVHADQTGAAGPRQVNAAKLRITCTGSNPGA
ncbi:MAG: hypothetical protein ACRETH_10925, partial [Steroidobacteraceae bacterium]